MKGRWHGVEIGLKLIERWTLNQIDIDLWCPQQIEDEDPPPVADQLERGIASSNYSTKLFNKEASHSTPQPPSHSHQVFQALFVLFTASKLD